MPSPSRRRVVLLFALLGAANVGAWAWALIAFRAYPVLLGTALLAYGLGLRHALDADHIAAIDNVTRKLLYDGERTLGVGVSFSFGHSTVVVAASVAIAATATTLEARLAQFRGVGSTVGTLVSAAFLLAIAAMNGAILRGVYRAFRRLRAGETLDPAALHAPLGGKWLARLVRPLFGMIRRDWQMYPLGLLFGLGFDTATEIGLLGIAAAQGARGMPVWSILVFPALFTAAMSLVDTADGVLMAGAYGWAAARPLRRVYYNLVVTALSVVVATLVGGVEVLALLADKLALRGPFWRAVDTLASHFGLLGYLVVGLFLATWLLAAALYRVKRYDTLEAAP